MKRENKRVQKIEFKNAEMVIENDRLVIVEYDKDGNVTDEFDLISELESDFLNEIGFNISFTRNIVE